QAWRGSSAGPGFNLRCCSAFHMGDSALTECRSGGRAALASVCKTLLSNMDAEGPLLEKLAASATALSAIAPRIGRGPPASDLRMVRFVAARAAGPSGIRPAQRLVFGGRANPGRPMPGKNCAGTTGRTESGPRFVADARW